MAEEEEKKKVEEKTEEKKKEIAWWKRLSPITIIGGAIVVFLLTRSMEADVANKNSYLLYIGAVIAVLYLLAQVPKTKEEDMINPKEAELLVERECERKNRWGQFGPMIKYEIGPVSGIQHRDGKGIYYDVAVAILSPYDRPKYYAATVMAKGIEKGFVYLNESIGPLTGREIVQEKTIIPEWMTRTRDYPLLEKLIFRER